MAPVAQFAALGDDTRMRLVERLGAAGALSITELTDGTRVSRQAVTKHLQVLSRAGLVRDARRGRERVWTLDPGALREVSAWVDRHRRLWEERVDRLEDYLTHPSDPEPKP